MPARFFVPSPCSSGLFFLAGSFTQEKGLCPGFVVPGLCFLAGPVRFPCLCCLPERQKDRSAEKYGTGKQARIRSEYGVNATGFWAGMGQAVSVFRVCGVCEVCGVCGLSPFALACALCPLCLRVCVAAGSSRSPGLSAGAASAARADGRRSRRYSKKRKHGNGKAFCRVPERWQCPAASASGGSG